VARCCVYTIYDESSESRELFRPMSISSGSHEHAPYSNRAVPCFSTSLPTQHHGEHAECRDSDTQRILRAAALYLPILQYTIRQRLVGCVPNTQETGRHLGFKRRRTPHCSDSGSHSMDHRVLIRPKYLNRMQLVTAITSKACLVLSTNHCIISVGECRKRRAEFTNVDMQKATETQNIRQIRI
jgi:hypothetical protein